MTKTVHVQNEDAALMIILCCYLIDCGH